MNKYYIKFEEGNIESLNRTCRKAEEMGYKKLDKTVALQFERYWILQLTKFWYYCTSNIPEEDLIREWYTEMKLEKTLSDINSLERWDEIINNDWKITIVAWMERDRLSLTYDGEDLSDDRRILYTQEEMNKEIKEYWWKLKEKPKTIQLKTESWDVYEIEEDKFEEYWFNLLNK